MLDRATQAALDDLAAAGLITKTTVAVRALHPPSEPEASALTADERERADFPRAVARRKLKAAKALMFAQLSEEAVLPATEMLQALARARAIEERLPPPPDLAACARPPFVWPADKLAAIEALAVSPAVLDHSQLDAISALLAE